MSADVPTDERKAFLGRGWAMPVALDPRTGLVASAAYEQDIRQSILIILETAPGERVMRPNFGCGIHELVFAAVDSTTLQRIRSTVEEALRRCEARIDVLAVNVNEAATIAGRAACRDRVSREEDQPARQPRLSVLFPRGRATMKPSRPPHLRDAPGEASSKPSCFARARAWIPSWGLDDDERDFGRALLKIAARFGSEVTERLDRAGEKLRLGFLDWLAVPAEAARPARLPVVFKLTDRARDAKLATAPTRLQAQAAGASVMLETETDVLVLPRQLQVLVGVDAGADAFYLPPPGLSSLAPLEPLPTQWQLKSFASAGATTLQLDPEQGLAVDMLVELGGLQYRITKVNGRHRHGRSAADATIRRSSRS